MKIPRWSMLSLSPCISFCDQGVISRWSSETAKARGFASKGSLRREVESRDRRGRPSVHDKLEERPSAL